MMSISLLKYILIIVCAYLLGGLSFGWLVGKMNGVNILTQGSGNPGFTNVWRTLGIKNGVLVLVGDVLKGFLSVYIGATLCGDVGMMLGFGVAIFGHSFSYMLHFKGGKGIATAAGGLLYISPPVMLLCMVILALIVGTTKYMSLGSITVAVLCPIFLYLNHQPAIVYGLVACCAVYVIYLHRANIKRLLNGTENKIGQKRR